MDYQNSDSTQYLKYNESKNDNPEQEPEQNQEQNKNQTDSQSMSLQVLNVVNPGITHQNIDIDTDTNTNIKSFAHTLNDCRTNIKILIEESKALRSEIVTLQKEKHELSNNSVKTITDGVRTELNYFAWGIAIFYISTEIGKFIERFKF